MPTLSAPTPLDFHPADHQGYSLNFTQFGLNDIPGRTIQTVNTVVATPAGPSFTQLAPNSVPIKGEKGQTVEIGNAATWAMSGGAVGTDYDLTVTVTYSDGSVVNGGVLARCRNK